MTLLEQAIAGFATVDVEPAVRASAARNLERWLREPAFAPYQPQIHWLIARRDWAGLLDRFYQILPFGTGGRRGAVGIGPNRMNAWTLAASVQGHCEYLRERFPDAEPLRVVLGYDVRQFEDQRRNYNPVLPNPVLHLSSKKLAHIAAGVYAANGIHSLILPENSPRYMATPELSYAIRLHQAHGGLNLSASHNPPDDNGGKFYDERGGQPVPPDDQIMADLVEQVAGIKEVPWAEAVRCGKVHFLDSRTHQGYLDLLRKQSLVAPPRFDELEIVFTPLHGVGAGTAMELLTQQGFRVQPVVEQMEPNGQFPNVTQTPNPEVPACFDRARALAESLQADLVLATDPDADRLGALLPDGRGGYPFVDGHRLAALLTHFKLSKLAETGTMPARPIVIKTLVTTSLVTHIAHAFGVQIVEDLLVGFKYIADVLWQLEQHGAYQEVEGRPEDFVLGVEESHGALVTAQLRDKDAAGAALLMAEMALDLKRQRRTALELLDEIHARHGYFRNDIRNLVLPGIEGRAKMARMLLRLRQQPPASIGGLRVVGVEDLWDEAGRLGPIKGATDRAARNVLVFALEGSARVALRPSGTEPKAKAYIEVGGHQAPEAIDALAQLVGDDFVAQCTRD